MNLISFDLKTVAGYQSWLEKKIRQLSVTALSSSALTCNACGEIAGTYIIEYQGQTFRLPGRDPGIFKNLLSVFDSQGRIIG